MKVALITANLGSMDLERSVPPQNFPYDRFYFNEKSPGIFPGHTSDTRMRAKFYKIVPHLDPQLEEYDIFIWIDGNIQIKSEFFIQDLVVACSGAYSFAISKHPERSTIYEEADFIVNQLNSGSRYLSSRYSVDSIRKEIAYIGPGLEGLFYCGVFARVNLPEVNRMCEAWMLDNLLFSNFDQLNFVSNIHRFGLRINTFDFGGFNVNKYYSRHSHK